jgi:hypothetical protein
VGLVIGTLLALALIGTAASATPKSFVLKRCGYARFTYGRSGVYPWQMSCGAAQKVVTASANPHAKMIAFGPGEDGAAVRIDGRYWVCTGQMGFYNCGYPYRPATVHGAAGYKGPFTEDVEYETCSVVDPSGSKCPATVEFTQPSG